MTSPFVIYAVPRSRTFWLSQFLSYGEWTCDHDPSIRLRGLDDLQSLLSTPLFGAVDTAAAPWWRLVHKLRPDIRTVVIRRPVAECMESLVDAGGPACDTPEMWRLMTRMDAKLDQIERRVPGVLSVQMADLDTVEGCKTVFEHCLQRPFDPEWHARFAPLHLLVNFPAQVRYCQANAQQIARMAATASQAIRRDLTLSRRVSSEGITYQEEPFDLFLRDGRALIAQHHIAIGKPADEVGRMNVDLMRALADNGALHVMTARSNGRMFGYLMTVTTPGFESAEAEMHTTAFYADPCAAGAGAKLYRAALAAAKARGAKTAFSRAGVRASGPRLGALFRRFGAEQFGQLYRVDLQ